MQYPIYQIDAFAEKPFTGNPAAVMPLEAWLADDLMQNIAAENNLAETAFIVRVTGGSADFSIRWFTPAVEVPLCGHATLASAHVIFHHLNFKGDVVRFNTLHAGPLSVTRREGHLSLALPSYPPHPEPAPEGMLAAVKSPPETVLCGGIPGGEPYWLLVYNTAAEVHALSPDFKALGATGCQVIATAPGDSHDFVSRFFAPAFGIDEDPVTGSSHCRLVPYWAERLVKTTLTARQISKRGGNLWCTLEGDRVHLAGTCVEVMRGMMSV